MRPCSSKQLLLALVILGAFAFFNHFMYRFEAFSKLDYMPNHISNHDTKYERNQKPNRSVDHEPDHVSNHESNHDQNHEPDHVPNHESNHDQNHESNVVPTSLHDVSNLIEENAEEKHEVALHADDKAGVPSDEFSEPAEPSPGEEGDQTRGEELTRPSEGRKPKDQKGSMSAEARLENSPLHQSRLQNVTKQKSPPVKSFIHRVMKVVRARVKTYFENQKLDIDFTPGEAIPTNKVRRLLIASSWRSGSSFLGEIMSSYPGTFYSFEPLILYKRKAIVETQDLNNYVQLLRDIFTCNQTSRWDYLDFMKNHTFLLRHNQILYKTCYSFNKNLCFDPNFHTEMCRYLPFNVIKTVRADLIHLESLLEDPVLDLRVVYLIRDPRGALHSRRSTSWCATKMCNDPPTVCDNMLSNLKTAEIYQEKYPDRFLTVRFEDLSLFPERTTRRIVEIAGLQYHRKIDAFLQTHTHKQRHVSRRLDTYTTFRNSTAVPFKWRESFTFGEVKAIQEHCHQVLDRLGLTCFKNDEEYRNKNISVLVGG